MEQAREELIEEIRHLRKQNHDLTVELAEYEFPEDEEGVEIDLGIRYSAWKEDIPIALFLVGVLALGFVLGWILT